MLPPNSVGENSQDYNSWQEYHRQQDFLIPLEVDKDNRVTGFVVLDDKDFPEGGQNTLFDYVRSHFSESCVSLTIHHELGDQALEDGYLLTLFKLARSIDQSDAHTRCHALRTSAWSERLARKMGLEEDKVEEISLAGKLHDVGKVVVPKNILTKPSRLTFEEWSIMRRHPNFAALIMEPSARLRSLIPSVRAHHEHFDGSGYPHGLSGDQIPMAARIIAVADAYATMTEGRIYKNARSIPDALGELERCSGKQFDPTVVAALAALVTDGDVSDDYCDWDPN